MKNILLFVLLLFLKTAYSQSGKIHPKNKIINLNEANTYVYKAPKGFIIPEKCWIHSISDDYNIITTPLVLKNGKYQFSLKTKDSESVIVITVVDKNLNPIETNNNKGYIIYLKNKTTEELQKSKLKEIELRLRLPNIYGIVKNENELFSNFENLYNQNPNLKEERNFDLYLDLKQSKDSNFKNNEVSKIINSLIKKGSENNLIVAHNQLLSLNKHEEKDSIYNLILKKYPLGRIAKKVFIKEVESLQNKTSYYIINLKIEFVEKFNDSSEQFMNVFYFKLLETYITEQNIQKIDETEELIQNKLSLAIFYDNYTQYIVSQNQTDSIKKIAFAEYLSKKSIDIVDHLITNPNFQEHELRLPIIKSKFLETFALVLFKLNKYKEAFELQEKINCTQFDKNLFYYGEENEVEKKERYALYAEKAKGIDFTISYIEREFEKGTSSAILKTQLERLYNETEISKNTNLKYIELAQENLNKQNTKLYGSIKAPDFELENLEGKKVKLSDYRGKIVILDFWGLWCAPCKASFPEMQELVNQYKNVEFLFIDTNEKMSKEKIREKVSAFIKDGKYTFNVLYDFDYSIKEKYQINKFPSKIIIDKDGYIVSRNSSTERIKEFIVAKR